MLINQNINQAINTVNNAQAILITAGAGIGVDSGLPDFRGNKGLWQAYPTLGKASLNFSDIANQEQFKVNPKLAWGFYGHRLRLYRDINPHQGFTNLRKFAQNLNNYFIITSNVDGQFQKAQFPDNKIYEVHGSIHNLQCTIPCCAEIWSSENLQVNINSINTENCLWLDELPKCKYCNALARPNILMFNDFAWINQHSEIQANTLYNWYSRLPKNCQVVGIEIGAGTAIPTIRHFGESMCHTLIRINPREAHKNLSYSKAKVISLPQNALEAILTLIN